MTLSSLVSCSWVTRSDRQEGGDVLPTHDSSNSLSGFSVWLYQQRKCTHSELLFVPLSSF